MTATDPTGDPLFDYLAAFPDADAVAAECRRLGVRGVIGECDNCALARLLPLALPDYDGLAGACVDAEVLTLGYAGDDPEELDLPPACVAFVRDFDDGCYPDLVLLEAA